LNREQPLINNLSITDW